MTKFHGPERPHSLLLVGSGAPFVFYHFLAAVLHRLDEDVHVLLGNLLPLLLDLLEELIGSGSLLSTPQPHLELAPQVFNGVQVWRLAWPVYVENIISFALLSR